MTSSKHGAPESWASVSSRVHICATEGRQLINAHHSLVYYLAYSNIQQNPLNSYDQNSEQVQASNGGPHFKR